VAPVDRIAQGINIAGHRIPVGMEFLPLGMTDTTGGTVDVAPYLLIK
jgi:hypothetical protein